MIDGAGVLQENISRENNNTVPIAKMESDPVVVITLGSILSRYAELGVEALQYLSSVKCESIELKKNKKRNFFYQGNAEAFVVKKGWLSLCQPVSACRYDVCNVYMPGDLVGVRESFFDNNEIAILAIENCVLDKFSVEDLHSVYDDCEAVKKAIISYVMVNDNILIERLKSCTHHKAEERIAYLLLEILARFNFNKMIDGSIYTFPVTQEIVGELLGITSVHVSRCMTSLEQKKMIRKSRSAISILQPDLLAQQAGFNKDLIYGKVSACC